MEEGEWVPDFPDRSIHGYRISQLFSSNVDPAEILHDYRTTRFPERFYNLKIGMAWADTQNRITSSEVLSCCGEETMLDRSAEQCTMGVDTGRELHVVISRQIRGDEARRQVVYVILSNSVISVKPGMNRASMFRSWLRLVRASKLVMLVLLRYRISRVRMPLSGAMS